MIGTIRKHSAWLWWLIAGLTVISFVYWGVAPSQRNHGGIENGDYGTIYGRRVTQEDYANARHEVYLFYWFHNGEWPDRGNISAHEMDQEIYVTMMLERKAHDMGIYASEDAVAKQAALLLHSLDRNNQHVTTDVLDKQVLGPEGMTLDDFERLARRDVMMPQLIQALGLSGALVTPEEAQALYENEHREIVSQAVFFLASNYLSDVSATPAAVAQFYTNAMAEYRLPDRVQVNYVEFNVTNYFAAAEQKIGTTNLNLEVEQQFRQYGMDAAPGAKTEQEAKAVIRDDFIRRQARIEALTAANNLATEAEGKTPVHAEDLNTVAKQNGLAVRATAPFSAQYGPSEFSASEAFVRAAFSLTPDEPIAGPLDCGAAFYVIALDKKLPSEIPSFDSIRDRVASDYKMEMATQLAQRAGTNFAYQLSAQMATGKTFAAASVAAGQHPESLPQFSLETTELPELNGRVDFRQIRQVAYTTAVGRPSGFEQTADGGFVLCVEKKLPVNATMMASQLPDYIVQLRRARESEAFNAWVQTEANRELHDTPLFKDQAAQDQAPQK